MGNPGPRPSIRSLMVLVLIAALGAAAYRTLRRELVVFGAFEVGWVAFWCWVVRDRPRASFWAFWVGSVAANFLIGLCSAFLLSIAGYAIMFLVTVTVLSVGAGCGINWARRSDAGRWPGRLAWASVAVLVLSPPSMMLTNWPLRLAFAWSRPALEEMADRVASDRALEALGFAGVYEIVGTRFDPRSGEVALYIDNDPSGRSGFLRLPAGRPRAESDLYTNLNIKEALDDRWSYRNED